VQTYSIPFSLEHPQDFFMQFPAAPAVFELRGASDQAEAYVSKTTNLRRRLQRLLAPQESQSKRLNLRERVALIEYCRTGSDFESMWLLYRALRRAFPESYQKRLRLRATPVVRLNLENEYPRAYVTTRIGKLSGRSLYYGPFRSRAGAEKFLNDSLDLFKMRRCTFDLNPDPSFPGCVYSEMKMCLAPCFKGCTDEAYAAEVERVRTYFDTAGQSQVAELEAERERLSESLDFEGAAVHHAKAAKVKVILAACDPIYSRLDRLDALMVQPSLQPGSVELFRFGSGGVSGPRTFAIEAEDESQSMESRLRATLEQMVPEGKHSIQEFSKELAMLKRWYYRTHKVGEIFFAGSEGELPIRRIVRGVGRVHRGEKEAAEPSPAPELPGEQAGQH
jgi:excinuclease ABC subunit C